MTFFLIRKSTSFFLGFLFLLTQTESASFSSFFSSSSLPADNASVTFDEKYSIYGISFL